MPSCRWDKRITGIKEAMLQKKKKESTHREKNQYTQHIEFILFMPCFSTQNAKPSMKPVFNERASNEEEKKSVRTIFVVVVFIIILFAFVNTQYKKCTKLKKKKKSHFNAIDMQYKYIKNHSESLNRQFKRLMLRAEQRINVTSYISSPVLFLFFPFVSFLFLYSIFFFLFVIWSFLEDSFTSVCVCVCVLALCTIGYRLRLCEFF